MSTSSFSVEGFYSIARAVYSILVLNCCFDPVESVKVVGFWIWLDLNRYKNVLQRQLSLPPAIVNELAVEALACLHSLDRPYPYYSHQLDKYDISITQMLFGHQFSLKFLGQNRVTATQTIRQIVKEICTRSFGDIMQDAIIQRIGHNLALSLKYVSSSTPFMVERNVSAKERMMFITFSKGFPVSEYEVLQFFTLVYGDCIQCVLMQPNSRPNQQALFALVVFYSSATISTILNGQDKAKFKINKKDVWARKYERRCPSISLG